MFGAIFKIHSDFDDDEIARRTERVSMESEKQRHSSASCSSESDGYHSEVFEDVDAGEQSLSEILSSLITAPFNDSMSVTPVRSSFTLQPGSGSSGSGREMRKRSSPGVDPSPEVVKRARKRPPLPFCSNSQDAPSTPKSSGVALLRSQSVCMPLKENKSPTQFSSPGGDNEERLIGDNSKPHALPLIKGKYEDLKYISSETVADLLCGKYDQIVKKYTLIDCRYPYEYEGGHIRGAKNIWQKEDLHNQYLSDTLKYPEEGKRDILIFHCEFSSKRGPDMCRYLRQEDRTIHGIMKFPQLYYPELYLIEGGYKAFFQDHSAFCEPKEYVQMEDQKHSAELSKLRTDCPRRRRLGARQNSCSRLKWNLS